MELNSIVHFLQNKCILVTGATGFLAKLFVEKILRTQPNVKKLFLLLRAADSESGIRRFENEVLGKDLFRILKEDWSDNFNARIAEKVTIVPGDISCNDLGIQDINLKEEITEEVNIIINFAASTRFEERYDTALATNTMGPLHTLIFAKKCPRLEVFVHVSTAYVWGEKEGVLVENAFKIGEALDETVGRLDIDAERKMVEKKLNELSEMEASESAVTLAMKDLGTMRAKMHGWPNTYVFTKAMGEMLIGHHKNNISLVIMRPTMITSTYRDPFPGWIEGRRTIDSFIVGYGKGRLTFLVCNPYSIIDAIPADMVVNATIAAMVTNANQISQKIYHVASSATNPLKIIDIKKHSYCYFTKTPWINKDGDRVEVCQVKFITSMESFNRYIVIRYLLPLKALDFANTVFCKYFTKLVVDGTKKIKLARRLVDTHKPYLFFKASFEDMNTERLRMEVRDAYLKDDAFCFDPRCIVWADYFVNTHIPGLLKYAFE